jgi:hypothetical protein
MGWIACDLVQGVGSMSIHVVLVIHTVLIDQARAV